MQRKVPHTLLLNRYLTWNLPYSQVSSRLFFPKSVKLKLPNFLLGLRILGGIVLLYLLEALVMLSLFSCALLSLLFSCCYVLYLAITRLYLSPVASIPGPRLAALSFWYEFYYDVVLGGRYTWKIADLHEQYGPIIRINPFEVHINDPDFYDEVYVAGGKRKTDMWSWTVSSEALSLFFG